MRIELDLSLLAGLPVWTHYAGLALAWYSAAGRVIHRMTKSDYWNDFVLFDWDQGLGPFVVWALSPLTPVVLAAWVFLGIASGGLIPPPWRKSLWV
jgi:hypothetical protein